MCWMETEAVQPFRSLPVELCHGAGCTNTCRGSVPPGSPAMTAPPTNDIKAEFSGTG